MSERIRSSIIEQANDHVLAVEAAYLHALFDWKDEAERRAESCGCPNCVGEPARVTQAIVKETNRVYFPDIPQEDA